MLSAGLTKQRGPGASLWGHPSRSILALLAASSSLWQPRQGRSLLPAPSAPTQLPQTDSFWGPMETECLPYGFLSLSEGLM